MTPGLFLCPVTNPCVLSGYAAEYFATHSSCSVIAGSLGYSPVVTAVKAQGRNTRCKVNKNFLHGEILSLYFRNNIAAGIHLRYISA